MDHLRVAIKVFLDEGYQPKWIALKLHVSYHTVLRSDPSRFATARRGVANNRKADVKIK